MSQVRVALALAMTFAAGATAAAPQAAAQAPTPPAPCPAPERAGGPAPETLRLVPATFADLPGWTQDRHAEVLPALLASCSKLTRRGDNDRIGVDGYSGSVRAWRPLCTAAARVRSGDHAAARAVLEAELRPYAVHGGSGPDGKFTGYYVASLRGSRTRHGRFQTPIYGRPPDLVSVDLTAFLPDAHGQRVWGRYDAQSHSVVPYATRAEIRRGALAGKGLELLWVDDPVDALFAQIQGSGKVALDDGSEVWIGFAGKNGRPYVGVGKVLRELGELPPGGGTMQGIRAWFAAHRDRFDEIADRNESFGFFQRLSRPSAFGSQGVALTPGRSMAVDRAYIAASTPVWIDTRAPSAGTTGDAPWQRLLVAQDTGGGILGAVRGDLYWGDDAAAADVAGRMGNSGRAWVLLPRQLAIPDRFLAAADGGPAGRRTPGAGNGADLVDVATVIPDAVLDIRYATAANFTGAKLYSVARCLLRRNVAARLARVAEALRRDGRRLLLWDCYRPASVQRELWRRVPDPRYVAEPRFAADGTPIDGSRHSRGAAVDIGLVAADGSPVVLPTQHDDFTERARRDRALRASAEGRRLDQAMTAAGFVGLPSEWWHYDAPEWASYPLADQPLR